MTKPKAAFVRINKDFLLVTSFIRGMIAIKIQIKILFLMKLIFLI